MARSYIIKRQEHFNEMLALSVPLALLVVGVSTVGIFTPNFYANETLSWQVQSLGQDIIDLILIAPALLVITLLTKSNRIGILLWGGVIIYLIYTFVIYSFDVHFNKLFIAYCLTLGLSFYAFLYFLYTQFKEPTVPKINGSLVRKVIGIYFLSIAVVFYFLWLSDVLPAIASGTTPKILVEAGIPTNPVHVIDLAIFLPGIFITGILLLRNKKAGLIMTPVMLVFFIFMDVTIGSLSAMMMQKGLEESLVLTYAMGGLALFSLALLVWYMKSMNSEGV